MTVAVNVTFYPTERDVFPLIVSVAAAPGVTVSTTVLLVMP